MKRAILLMFLSLSQAYVHLDQCFIDKRSLLNVWEERLIDKLMCNYDSSKPPKPSNGSDAIVVIPTFIVKTFQVWSEEQIFVIFTLTHFSWIDERLQWDPNDFDGIDETSMREDKLWVPGLSLHNNIDLSYDHGYYPSDPCKIIKNGGVSCLSAFEFAVMCPMDFSDWPFDTQVCSLVFNSSVPRTKGHFKVDPKAVLFIGAEYGTEWDIMDYTQEEMQHAEKIIKLNFTLVRHTTILTSVIIFPTILLSILTLSTLILDVRSFTRVYIAGFSLMCHLYFLEELSVKIPSHSMTSPRILLYFRGSVIMTAITIILTLLIKCICARGVQVPNFISIVNEYAYKSYAKWVIYPRWKVATDLNEEEEPAKEWTDFASILNSTWIYISLFVYIIMCCLLIPLPSALKQQIYPMSYDFD